MAPFRVLLVLGLVALATAATPETSAIPKMLLRQDWAIQTSSDVREGGGVLSTEGFKPRGWYSATLPSTVLNALVQDRVYPDPYHGMNLRSISGTSYPIGFNFSNAPMPPDSPSATPGGTARYSG